MTRAFLTRRLIKLMIEVCCCGKTERTVELWCIRYRGHAFPKHYWGVRGQSSDECMYFKLHCCVGCCSEISQRPKDWHFHLHIQSDLSLGLIFRMIVRLGFLFACTTGGSKHRSELTVVRSFTTNTHTHIHTHTKSHSVTSVCKAMQTDTLDTRHGFLQVS